MTDDSDGTDDVEQPDGLPPDDEQLPGADVAATVAGVRAMAPVEPQRDDDGSGTDREGLDEEDLDEREQRQSSTRKAAGPPPLPEAAELAQPGATDDRSPDDGADGSSVPPTDPV